MSLVPVTTIPHAASAPTMDGAEGAGEYTGPALDLSRRWSGGGNCAAFPDCGTAARDAAGRSEQHLRQGHLDRRRPVPLHPRQGRVPELRGHARRVHRALARRLDRDPDRPARRLVGDQLRHRDDVQARHLPVHERPVELQRQRRQRGLLGARRRQPPGLLDRTACGDGRRGPERARRAGRLDGHVGRHERHRHRRTATARPAATTSRSRSRSPLSRPQSARRPRRPPAARRRT